MGDLSYAIVHETSPVTAVGDGRSSPQLSHRYRRLVTDGGSSVFRNVIAVGDGRSSLLLFPDIAVW